jgi:tRNA 5-methylaminomethyl-2-thiouridine biosynthesis bifunctional protein
MTQFSTADIIWRDGLPYSKAFDDVYFSSDNGLLETDYVFMDGNNLVTRWQSLKQPDFCIIETGFGTGLNFLSAARCWLMHAPTNARLKFISLEKYPLTLSDLELALLRWPELNEFSHEMLLHYQHLLADGHCYLFNGRIQLRLCLGDALQQLTVLNSTADAWFLDGFAPAKNPDMWQDALFKEMGRLSQHGTSFATFTSAGKVRRSLTAAGFVVTKRPGFGRKREMLTGTFSGMQHDD